MQRITRKLRALTAAAIFIISLFIFFLGCGIQRAYAAPNAALGYEQSDVLEDLKQMTVDGKPFAETDYPFDVKNPTQLISFTEYCYAYAPTARANYGLYAYIYNPQNIRLDFGSTQNKIQFAYGADEAGNYANYPLKRLSVTADGKFAKYKVELTNAKRAEILSKLNPAERVYRVSGVTLKTAGEKLPVEYSVATTFTYTGYAKGYGQYEGNLGNLTCTRQELETAELEVKGTYYRYARDAHTATQINSVYFAVDNKLLDKYGTIYRIWAEYWQYDLAPIVVMNYENLFNAIENAPAVLDDKSNESGAINHDFKYYLAAYDNPLNSPSTTFQNVCWTYGEYPYRLLHNANFVSGTGDNTIWDRRKPLSFNTDGRPQDLFISRDSLFKKIDELDAAGKAYGEEHLSHRGGKGYTAVDLTADDLFDIKGFTSGSGFIDWFIKLFGHSVTQDIENISPIKRVGQSDLLKSDICNELLIATEDKQDFLNFCDKATKDGQTVFLFRYGTSDYKVYDCVAQATDNQFSTITNLQARFQTIDRDFDIIQLGFGNAKELVIIPVVASPIDNLAGSQGIGTIIKETNRRGVPVWLIVVIAVVAVILILLIVIPKRGKDKTNSNRARRAANSARKPKARTPKKR